MHHFGEKTTNKQQQQHPAGRGLCDRGYYTEF